MDLGLEGKAALVTGASRGIGKAIAKALAREGARLALVARSHEGLDKLVEELGGQNSGHRCLPLDLERPGSEAALHQWLEGSFGPVEIVVHNLGGTLGVTDPLYTQEDWAKVWRANLEVAAELNRRLIPHMQGAGWGRVLHIGSVSGFENLGPVAYCTIKAAVVSYARSLGRVLAKDGIVVTSISPGAVWGESGHWAEVSQSRPERVEKLLNEELPQGRFAAPEEIAEVAVFLCSALASQCTGTAIQVDGGYGRAFVS